jgi:hypothetical protein
MAHRLPILSNPVLRVLSKYILAVMADKSVKATRSFKEWKVLQAEATVI